MGDILFIHLPKCAGSSVSHALYNREIGHKTIRDYKDYQRYKVVTVLRDPFERLVSVVNYLNFDSRYSYDQKYRGHFSGGRLLDKISNIYLRTNLMRHVHFRDYRYFLSVDGENLYTNIVGFDFRDMDSFFSYINKENYRINSFDNSQEKRDIAEEMSFNKADFDEIILDDYKVYNEIM